jgi:hypothetical protein
MAYTIAQSAHFSENIFFRIVCFQKAGVCYQKDTVD